MVRTVFLVEDNEHLRKIFAALIQSAGYETVVAASGTEALQRAGSANPGLILLDLDLPDMSGHEVARQIRKTRACARIPIIGCSAFNSVDERQKVMRSGMVDYLEKPVSPAELRKSIQRFFPKSS